MQRSSRGGPDYLPQLKQDILDVIRKDVQIDPEDHRPARSEE